MITPRKPQRHPATLAWEKWASNHPETFRPDLIGWEHFGWEHAHDAIKSRMENAFLDGFKVGRRHKSAKAKKGKA